MAIPSEPEPFFKWDPDGHGRSARAATRAAIAGGEPPSPVDVDERRKAVKRWLLRWAWLLSTAVLVFGYVVLFALLTDRASWLGV